MRTDDLETVSRLGGGFEGTTWLQQDRNTREYYAWKDARVRRTVEGRPREVWVRAYCMPRYHASLLDFHGWCYAEAESPQRCNIYYEYCAGGDLGSLIPIGNPAAHPASFIWHVFIQVAEALDAMHNRGPRHVIHRDVKPENVYLTSRYRPNHGYPTVKLGDYRTSTSEPVTGVAGSARYMGPEIECSAKGDVWAVGAVIHTLCHGFGPVSENGDGWRGDPNARRPRDLPSRYSDALHWQVMSCLRADRGNRPNSETLVRRLHRERPREHS